MSFRQARGKTEVAVCGYLFLLSVFYTMPVYAVTMDLNNLSAASMLYNIAQAVPNLMRLVTALAYVLGMIFIFIGVGKLKHMGEMRTQMSHEHNVMVPITYIFVGAMLLYLPTSVQVGLSTFWTNPAPYGYETGSAGAGQDQWGEFINTAFSIIQLFGTIAFIRGLIILSRAGGGHHQQGGVGKGLTHIIAGIFCINIYQFVQVIMITIGIQTY